MQKFLFLDAQGRRVLDIKQAMKDSEIRTRLVTSLKKLTTAKTLFWLQSFGSDQEELNLLAKDLKREDIKFLSGELQEIPIETNRIILLKKVYKTGEHLQGQLDQIKSEYPELEVQVFLIAAHSGAKVEQLSERLKDAGYPDPIVFYEMDEKNFG